MVKKISITPWWLIAFAVVLLAFAVVVISFRADDPVKVLPTVDHVLTHTVDAAGEAYSKK